MRRLLLLIILACFFTQLAVTGSSRPDGWNDDTHSRDAVPDYERVFAADRVNRLDIEVIYQIKHTNDQRNLVFPFYTIPDDGSDY